jgi:N-acetylglucosaminyldiphosphoundecaprenol N-acetyl-beta-D-mannosaminyltransferase
LGRSAEVGPRIRKLIAIEVMRRGGASLRVFLLGAKPGVAEAAAAEAARRYGVQVVGSHHGYFDRSEPAPVVAAVAAARPDLLLAGLGEGQELFLHRHRDGLGAGVMIGVGGTLDVLAGAARRMPAWTSRLGVEWLFRVGLDRRRWGRLPRLFRFAGLVLRGLPR